MPNSMYRRAKFVEILHEIRKEMAHEADYDVDLFAELARSGNPSFPPGKRKKLKNPGADPLVDSDADPLRLGKDVIQN